MVVCAIGNPEIPDGMDATGTLAESQPAVLGAVNAPGAPIHGFSHIVRTAADAAWLDGKVNAIQPAKELQALPRWAFCWPLLSLSNTGLGLVKE